MRLPRRIPWKSNSELEQVCSWIYTDDEDLDAKLEAINRISAWKCITAIPHALESCLSLLVVILQDKTMNFKVASQRGPYLSLRQSYANAIIRLVNGLVDPLQVGPYARSIAAIAAQIGLPSWLVELRHAATHEDIPSLELLRQAARDSMSWLFHNYFMPTLNPTTSLSKADPLRPLSPILKQYKSLAKITARDASLRVKHQASIDATLREIERWIAEATVAASLKTTLEIPDLEPNAFKKWALEKLCDTLLERGMLVPLSKKKRIFPSGAFNPPSLSILIWMPLLKNLHSNHSEFPFTLSNRISEQLTLDEGDSFSAASDVMEFEDSNDYSGNNIPNLGSDSSYDFCIARWAFWIAEKWEHQQQLAISLLTSLGPANHGDNRENVVHKTARALLDALSHDDANLKDAIIQLELSSPSSNTAPTLKQEWFGGEVDVMETRLRELFSFDTPQPSLSKEGGQQQDRSHSASGYNESTEDLDVPSGWCLVERSEWRSCPIGVHYSQYGTKGRV